MEKHLKTEEMIRWTGKKLLLKIDTNINLVPFSNKVSKFFFFQFFKALSSFHQKLTCFNDHAGKEKKKK